MSEKPLSNPPSPCPWSSRIGYDCELPAGHDGNHQDTDLDGKSKVGWSDTHRSAYRREQPTPSASYEDEDAKLAFDWLKETFGASRINEGVVISLASMLCRLREDTYDLAILRMGQEKDQCTKSSSSLQPSDGSLSEASSSIASPAEPATSNVWPTRWAVLWDPPIKKGTVVMVFDTYEEATRRFRRQEAGGSPNLKLLMVSDDAHLPPDEVHRTANPFPGYKPVEVVDREELRARYAKSVKENGK